MPFDSDPVRIAFEIELQRSRTEVAELTQKVTALEEALKKGTRAKDDFAKSAGNAKSILEGFKGALTAVSPELANLVGGAQRGAQGLEAMAKAGAELGTTFAAGGVLLVGIGLVTLAVGGLALAWKDARDRADEAIRKQKEAAGILDKGNAVAGKMSAEEAEGAYRSGSISAGQYQSVLQKSGTVSSTGVDQARGLVAAAKGNLTIEGDGWRRRRTSSPELEDAQALLDQRIGEAAAAKVKAVGEEIRKKALADSKGAATRTASGVNAIDWNPVDWSGGIQVDTDRQSILSGIQGSSIDGTPGYTAPAPFTPIAGPTLADRLGSAGKGLAQYGLRAGALAQGDVGGALGGLGPTGAIVGGLQAIGKQGAAGVDKQLDGIKDAMIGALHELPEILGEVIPEFVTGLVTEFVPALVEALPAIIKGAIIDLPLGIAKGILSAIGGLFGGTPGGGGFLGIGDKNSGFLGIGNERARGEGGMHGFLGLGKNPFGRFQTGGRVPSDGLYQLERGEEVIGAAGMDSASSQGRAAKQSSMSVGGLHIHAQGAQLGRDWDRDLEDRLGRLFQRFGGGQTSITIGASPGSIGLAR